MVLYTPIKELETWLYQDDSKPKETLPNQEGDGDDQGKNDQKDRRFNVPLYFKLFSRDTIFKI